jgi:hypothetical protein
MLDGDVRRERGGCTTVGFAFLVAVACRRFCGAAGEGGEEQEHGW